MPLDALMKQYAGAYTDTFDWPQPGSHSDEDEMEETEGKFVIIKFNCADNFLGGGFPGHLWMMRFQHTST